MMQNEIGMEIAEGRLDTPFQAVSATPHTQPLYPSCTRPNGEGTLCTKGLRRMTYEIYLDQELGKSFLSPKPQPLEKITKALI